MEGIILSSWDYIMGPQIERLWLTNNNSKLNVSEVAVRILREFNISKHSKKSDVKNKLEDELDLSTYSLMCGQLLLGEMDVSECFEQNVTRTYISELKILMSVVFRMKSWICAGTTKEVKNACLCIGLIYKHGAFNFILRNLFTLDIHLRKLADNLQNSKLSHNVAVKELSVTVLDLASLLDSLYHHNLPSIQNHVFLMVEDYLTSSILSEAIVSHLQTSGRTAVLGASEFKINQVINILSLFSSKEELNCSLSVNHLPLKSKVSAFYIQGIIKNSERDCEYLLEHAFDESLSLTVIDTDLCKVWQTWPFHENIERNRIFYPVTETGCLVPQLLKDLSFANKNKEDCLIIIDNFMKLLMIKAVSIVKTVSEFRNITRIPSKQELMTLFAIYTHVDFQMLLGCAEKIKPGIRCSVS